MLFSDLYSLAILPEIPFHQFFKSCGYDVAEYTTARSSSTYATAL